MTDDELLSPRPVPPNDGIQAAILERTARRVRAVVWRRRAMLGAAGLACFGLGWATTYVRPAPAPQVVYVEVPVKETPVADAPGSPQQDSASREHQRPERTSQSPSPAEMELAAEQMDDKPAAARRFREAGDRYLRDYSDYRAALRCYRNFLDEADPADRAVGPGDTWLLISLKHAREQESVQ
jgi:hypothetical protein